MRSINRSTKEVFQEKQSSALPTAADRKSKMKTDLVRSDKNNATDVLLRPRGRKQST